MKKENDLLQNFFEITGNEADSLIFLKSFKSLSPEKFALIYANTEIVLESFSALFYDLKILYSFGLYPVIIVSRDSISYIELFFNKLFNSNNNINTDELQCNILEFNSDINERLKDSINQKKIPFVVLETEDNLFSKIAQIASYLQSSKLLYLSEKGPIRNSISKEKLSLISIRKDYKSLIEGDILFESDKVLLNKFQKLLESEISHPMNIAITSPLTLLKELFTVNGSGTFIKLGSEIKHLNSIESLNEGKLTQLLESAFRKKIHPDFLKSNIDSIFLEMNYRGAALLKLNEYGALLSKFAVDEIARGEGIGRDIWNEMRKIHRTIFWRAKPENHIHKWYSKECQGMDKGKEWNVYWINLDIENIPFVCKYLRSQGQDFIV